MPAPSGVTSKSKDHRNRKNSHSAEAAQERKKVANQSPKRQAAQVRYLLNSIEESVAAGRQENTDEVQAEIKRLLARAEALEAQSGVA